MGRFVLLSLVVVGALWVEDDPKTEGTKPTVSRPSVPQVRPTATQASHPLPSFTGTWQTTYGEMTLTEQGGKIEGTYAYTSGATISGRREKNRFTFTYQEPHAKGEGWFELAADGKTFAGEWRSDGGEQWLPWKGERTTASSQVSFDGLWETTYGRMRLNQDAGQVIGSYSYAAGSKIAGSVAGRTLKVRYTEPTAAGEAEFTLAANGESFVGRWKPDGATVWQPWTGRRVKPKADTVWLVVIEANWENSLAEPEYSFGQMLKSFFSRDRRVQVRQRYFTDEASLRRWLTEVKYLAEPVVISLSTHGQPTGVSVGGQTIGAKAIAESLHGAGNVKLLHFSACLAMLSDLPDEIHRHLGPTKIPISGYTTSVDWGASAVFEFMYFELLLCRGYAPKKAHEHVLKLLPYGGDQQVKGTEFAPLGLKLRLPEDYAGR